jgi:hypothetical protein
MELYEDALKAYKAFYATFDENEYRIAKQSEAENQQNDAASKAFDDAVSTGTGMYEVKRISPSEFIKLDSGKRRLSLIEPKFIQTLGDVITFGAEKYAPGNWRLCEDTSRYKDALLRHIYAYLSGEQQDQETSLSHLAHAACNLMFLQYFDNLKKEEK